MKIKRIASIFTMFLLCAGTAHGETMHHGVRIKHADRGTLCATVHKNRKINPTEQYTVTAPVGVHCCYAPQQSGLYYKQRNSLEDLPEDLRAECDAFFQGVTEQMQNGVLPPEHLDPYKNIIDNIRRGHPLRHSQPSVGFFIPSLNAFIEPESASNFIRLLNVREEEDEKIQTIVALQNLYCDKMEFLFAGRQAVRDQYLEAYATLPEYLQTALRQLEFLHVKLLDLPTIMEDHQNIHWRTKEDIRNYILQHAQIVESLEVLEARDPHSPLVRYLKNHIQKMQNKHAFFVPAFWRD